MSYYNLTFSNLSTIGTRQIPIIRVEPSDGRPPRRALDALQRGEVIVFPTDTVYGLGCRIDHEPGVRRVFALKTRPETDALPVLLADAGQLDAFGRAVSAAARRLAARFWPGPLTIVVHRSDRVPASVAGGGPTVALRVPNHPVPRALIRAIGTPLIGTSANSHGMPAPVTAQLAVYDLGDRVDLVLDGGRAPLGVESTVVDCTGDRVRVLREGAIAIERLEEQGIAL